MTENELHELIARGEGPKIGFRRSAGRNVGRDLCAFANGEGGTVLVGVSGSGEITGVGNGNRAKAEVIAMARSADPAILVEIEKVGDVLRVVVPRQQNKPYSIGWRAFVRDGMLSRRLSNAEIKDLSYVVGRAHIDKEPCKNFSLDEHLDGRVWKRFIRLAKIPAAMHPILALRNMGLVDAEDRMTHAGAWLLARDIRRVSKHAYVSCSLVREAGETGGRQARSFHGSVPAMIDDVVAWILTQIHDPSETWREEEGYPELPGEALREGVANAVAHRDYRSREHVRVRVHKDRVEISSPGGLPEGMAETDLGTKSVPRNPLLHGMLARMDMVGGIGSGVRRMASLCGEHGVEQPGIEVSGNQVTITFPRPPAGQVRRPAKKKSRQPAVQSRKPSIQVRELVGVLDQARSRVEILGSLGLRNRSNLVANYLRPALDAGFIEMTIPEKPTSGKQKYRLTERGRELRGSPEAW